MGVRREGLRDIEIVRDNQQVAVISRARATASVLVPILRNTEASSGMQAAQARAWRS